MRSALVAAAFAAGVLAVPFHERRAEAPQYGDNVQTDVEVVYVTQVVTVTAGGEAPTYTTEAQHYGHKHSKKPVTTSTTSTYEAPAPPAYTPEPETTYEAPAPTYEAPTSTYEAPASSEPAASSPAAPASGSYEDTCLYHHNLHRANHTAPDLAWSQALQDTAQKIAQGCNYAHDVEMDGGGYGQNIAAGVSADNISAVITDLFYNGEEPLFAQQYGKPDPDMSGFELWGHFTQIVWTGTTEVGCFTADCSATGLGNTGSGVSPYFTVCNYKGPGNYAGEYEANVNPPTQNAPTANWDAGLSGSIPSSYKK